MALITRRSHDTCCLRLGLPVGPVALSFVGPCCTLFRRRHYSDGMSDITTTTERGKLTVGLDLGDRFTQVCVLDEDGEVMEEGRVTTTPRAFQQRFAAMPPTRLVLEAGTHSLWASRLLGELGHEVIVANPRMLRFIYGSDSKNDKADAAYLARVGKLDPALLHPVVHLPPKCEGGWVCIRGQPQPARETRAGADRRRVPFLLRVRNRCRHQDRAFMICGRDVCVASSQLAAQGL